MRFSHWMVRQVGYEALLHASRKALHRGVGQALENEVFEPLGEPPDDDTLRDSLAIEGDLATAVLPSSKELARHWEVAGESRRAGLLYACAAWSAGNASRHADALESAGRSMVLLVEQGDSSGGARVQISRGHSFERTGRYEEALAAYALAESLADQHSGAPGSSVTEAVHETLAARAGNGQGAILLRVGRYDEAVEALGRSRLRARAGRSPREEASSLNNLGGVHWYRGGFQEALGCYRESLALWHDAGRRMGEAIALGNIGNVHYSRGELKEALSLYDNGLALAREIGDLWGEAGFLNNVGSVRLSRGELREALAIFLESLDLHRTIGDRYGEAIALVNLGKTRHALGDLSETEAALTAAVAICVPAGMKELACDALAARSQSRLEDGRESDAREDANRAERMATETGYAEGEIRARLARARCEKSADLATEAVSRARALASKDFECDALLTRSEINDQAGHFVSARADAGAGLALAETMDMGAMKKRAERILAKLAVQTKP